MTARRADHGVAVAFGVLAVGAVVYVHTLFDPIAPPERLWSWSALAALALLAMAAARLGRLPMPAAAVLYDLATAASVWLLLPYASEPLRLVMVVFYAAAVAGQVIVGAGSPRLSAFGVVSVFGSAAIYFLMSPGLYSTPLALFLAGYGAVMVAFAMRLNSAAREVAAALGRVTEARDAKTRFIAAASHDLRQPLQAAALFFEQVARGVEGPRRERAVGGVRLALGETNALLESMLDHLRLDAAAVEARPESLSVAGLFDRLTRENEALAAAEGLDLSALPSRLWVEGDPNLTARVLRNLAHNVMRHARAERCRFLARRHGDLVRLYVIDDGRGLAREDHAGLFEAYVQGAASREAGGGLGLGLASSRRMGELMGGRVELDRRWRGGCAFFLELPSAEAGAHPSG